MNAHEKFILGIAYSMGLVIREWLYMAAHDHKIMDKNNNFCCTYLEKYKWESLRSSLEKTTILKFNQVKISDTQSSMSQFKSVVLKKIVCHFS